MLAGAHGHREGLLCGGFSWSFIRWWLAGPMSELGLFYILSVRVCVYVCV